MSAEFSQEPTRTIVAFLRKIGLPVAAGSVDDASFLPGIEVAKGGLVVDEAKLKYPGDLLHEAGHLAVTPAALRPHLSGQVETPGANADVIESAAMCWSYAACLHLQLDPGEVFHQYGYHGRGENLLFNFQLGIFPGVHELVSAGMTRAGVNMHDPDLRPFPAMKKWLRD
jgi:hypothetical protein